MAEPPRLAVGGTPAAWSLHRRLRWQLLCLLGLLWLAGSAGAAAVWWQRMGEVLDGALSETAEHLLMLPEGIQPVHDAHEAQIQVGPHAEQMVYQVSDARGVLRLRSPQAPTTVLDPGAPKGVRRAGDWHVLTLISTDGQRRAQVAEPLAHRRAALWASLGGQLLALLALLPVAALALGYVLRRAFRPLEAARRELQQRAPGQLAPLCLDQAPAELQPWLSTVNGLLARVEQQIAAERRFAAHTAHELRTPLAAARAQAQWLQQSLARPDAVPSPAAAADALARQLDRLTRLATRLLELARIDAGVALRRQPVDLSELVDLVLQDFPQALRAGRLVRADGEAEGIVVPGDIDALGIALRNLVDNALRHAGADARVQVRVWRQGTARKDGGTQDVASPAPTAERVGLEVVDDGPGVDAATLATLGRGFSPAGQRPTLGSGLGLALTATIAEQSGARLQLRSPWADGHGFGATLAFNPTGA